MKTSQLLVILAALTVLPLSLVAQDAAEPPAADDPVVVSIYGKEYTAGDIARIRKRIPTQFQQQTQHMSNRAFLETFGYLHALSHLAEQSGLEEKEPYKTQLAFNNMNFLAQAYLQEMRGEIEVTSEDVERYYQEHLNEYKEVRVSAIYLNYTPVPELAEKQGKPVVPEMEAWGKAEKLAAELRAGADFAELAREHSEDAASAEKGGDLGYFKPDDQLSQKIKETIFAMEEGQSLEPGQGWRALLLVQGDRSEGATARRGQGGVPRPGSRRQDAGAPRGDPQGSQDRGQGSVVSRRGAQPPVSRRLDRLISLLYRCGWAT